MTPPRSYDRVVLVVMLSAAALALPALSVAAPPHVPNVAGVTQYIETIPTASGPKVAGTQPVSPPSAGGTKASTGASKGPATGQNSAKNGRGSSSRASAAAAPKATPLGAAVSASKDGGLGRGPLLVVILVLVTLVAAGLAFARRRRAHPQI